MDESQRKPADDTATERPTLPERFQATWRAIQDAAGSTLGDTVLLVVLAVALMLGILLGVELSP